MGCLIQRVGTTAVAIQRTRRLPDAIVDGLLGRPRSAFR